MSKDIIDAIELIGEVISSGSKTGYDEDSVYKAWNEILNHLQGIKDKLKEKENVNS